MDPLHFEPSLVIYSLITIFVGICGVTASWYLLKRKVTPRLETPHQGNRIGSVPNRKRAGFVSPKAKQRTFRSVFCPLVFLGTISSIVGLYFLDSL